MDNLENGSVLQKLEFHVRAHTNRLIWIGLFVAGNMTGYLLARPGAQTGAEMKAPIAAKAAVGKRAAKSVAKKSSAKKAVVAKKSAKRASKTVLAGR